MLRRAAEFVAGLTESDEVLVIGATRQSADEFLRALPGDGRFGFHVMSFNQLAASLGARAVGEGNLAPLSQLSMEALASRVVYQARPKLRYFAPVSSMPGFARALAATIGELRLERTSPSQLASTGAPGQDLVHLLSAYEQELRERSLADLPILLQLATEEAALGRHRFLGLPIVLLDITLRSTLHRRLAAAIAAESPAFFAAILQADTETLDACKHSLGAEPESVTCAEQDGTLARLRDHLFVPELGALQPRDSTMKMFSAPGEGLECVEIARRIQAAAAKGVPFDEIAILLRSPERYQPLVEEALRRAGIPGYFSRGTLRPDPGGRAFLALLACASESCSASRFAEYLSLAQVPALDEHGAPLRMRRDWSGTDDELLAGFARNGTAAALAPEPEATAGLSTPAGWERLLVDAAVVGGADRWRRRLRGLENELNLQLRTVSEENLTAQTSLERRLEQLQRLETFALPLVELLAALPKQALWGDWISKLTEIAETALRNPEPVLSLINELRAMSDVGPVDLDEVYSVLSERLRFLRRQPPARRYGRVFVGSIEEARGRCFTEVFLPGLAEGVFPRRAQEDPLLLDIYRKALDPPLITQDTRVQRERLLLHIAAAAAQTCLTVSYSRIDAAQSRPRVPSFYALEVVRAAEGRLPDLHSFEKQLAEAAPSKLGWPAPVDPSQAIDDAEYDLAVLAELDSLQAASGGIARYLMEQNPHLARSLRARYLRWDKKRWSSADGIVQPDTATLDALAAARLANRSYSPTSLQQFSACPYKFLLYSIHQLREREAPVPLDQMDPLTRGSLFHAAQFALFRQLKRDNLLPVTGANLPTVLDLADAILDRVAAEYEEELAPAIERVWAGAVEDLRTDLRGWLRETATFDLEWLPSRFEFSFGLPLEEGRDEASRPEEVTVESARLRGSVDLVERHTRRNTLRITDHKTGKGPDNPPAYVGGGAVLQPALYSMAVEQLLNEKVESARLYYCTQRGNFDRVEMRMSDQVRSHARQVLETIDNAIAAGFLPAAPQKDACQICAYRPICGPHEELRTRGKPRRYLEPLLAMRDLL